MKKTISAILCLVMLVSCFTCLSLTAGAADATQYLKASATQCINDQITVNVKIAKGQSAIGAIVFFEYDPAVLAPVTGGTASAASAAEEQHGAKIDSSNVYSVAFTGNKVIGSTTADTAVLYATFKVVSANRPKTAIKVSCDQLLLDSKTLVRNGDDTAMPVATLNVATIPTVTKLSVVNVDGEGLKLTWGAVEGISQYFIYRCEVDENGKNLTSIARIGKSSGTAYKDTTVTVNKRYKYCVLCVIGGEAGDIGTTASAKFTSSLAAPAKVAVSCGKGCMNVSWSAVSGATKYIVSRRAVTSKGVAGEWADVATVTDTKYSDSSKFIAGNRYDYRVRAVKNAVKSAYSDFDGVKYVSNVPVITAISASNQADGTVKVYWRAVSGISKYRIYRCECNPDNTPKTAIVKIGEVTGKTEFIDNAEELASGVKYKYAVLCVVGENASDVGDTAKIVYNVNLSAPTGVSATADVGAMKITWKEVSGASSYRIYKRMVNKDGSVKDWTVIAEASGTSYVDSSKLERGFSYDYCVSAVRGKNESSRSASSRIKYNCNIPMVMAISTEKTADGKIKVYWKGVPGITKYRVYRSEMYADSNANKTPVVKIGEVNGTTSYIDTDDLAPGRYKYCVLCVVGENSGDVGDTAKRTIK